MVVILGIAGVADSAYLTSLKAADQAHGRAESSVCKAVSQTGCTIAMDSPMASIGPVPVSLIALVTYALIIGLGLMAMGTGAGAAWALAALTGIALGAVVYSVILAGYSYSQDSWCPFCIGLYGINAGLLIATVLQGGGLFKAVGEALLPPGNALKAVVVFAVLIAGSTAVFSYAVTKMSGDVSSRTATRVDKAFALGTFDLGIDGSPTHGPEDAAITLIKFSDFQCPFCSKMWGSVDEWARANPSRVRVVFKHHALSDKCNPMMRGAFHDRACQAAFAAECAHRQGKFWEMGAVLFANQRRFSDSDLEGYATELGLDVSAWKTCLADPTVARRIARDAMLARSIGAAGTPSAVINGVLFEGGMSPAALDMAADAVLQRAAETPLKPNAMATKLTWALAASNVPARLGEGLFPADTGASIDIVAFVDPSQKPSRALLLRLFEIHQVHPKLLSIGVRVLGEGKSHRILACGLRSEQGHFISKRVGETGGDPETLRASLESPDIEACLTESKVVSWLAEDSIAAARLEVDGATLIVQNKRVPADISLRDLDRLIALVLLAEP
ncbi:MAG: protein-disulfide isomerase/uncharacterized membrane protein [Myxococcota bacterium]|jgi:protein-disulfide isomerase/uncharacterized membrane protein